MLQEGPLRPVLECIDLLSDAEDEAGGSAADTVSIYTHTYAIGNMYLQCHKKTFKPGLL